MVKMKDYKVESLTGKEREREVHVKKQILI